MTKFGMKGCGPIAWTTDSQTTSPHFSIDVIQSNSEKCVN